MLPCNDSRIVDIWGHSWQETERAEARVAAEELLRTRSQRDAHALRLEGLGQDLGRDDAPLGVIEGHLARIASLEREVARLKQVDSYDNLFV